MSLPLFHATPSNHLVQSAPQQRRSSGHPQAQSTATNNSQTDASASQPLALPATLLEQHSQLDTHSEDLSKVCLKQHLWPTAARSKGGGVGRTMPQQAQGVTDLDKALSAARKALAQRQQTAERQLQRALKSLPVARVRGAIAHAASQGCAAATLREARAACCARDAEAARTLLEAAAADPFNGAAYRAAFARCASLDLGAACAAAAGIVAPRQENVRSQLSIKAAISPAAQLSGLFEEAEQLGLTAELQAAKEVLQHRQHAAVAALEAAATRADAAAFASALSTAWLVNARDEDVRAAARLLESRLQQTPEQPSTFSGSDWRLQERPRAGDTIETTTTYTSTQEECGVSGSGKVLTSSQVACMLQGRKHGNVQHLNLGLERLRCFGSALAPLTSLLELHAQSNCLTSLSGIEACGLLEHLSIQGNQVTSLSGLQACTRLRHLDAGLNRLMEFPSVSLPLEWLTHLSLHGNRFTHIPAVPWMTSLEVLYLQDNHISAVQPMHKLPSLRLINLSFNKLADPATLASFLPLPALAELYLNGNPLEKDPSYLEQRCRLLPHLEKDHSHARVPYEELEARLATELVASPVCSIALLQWQTTGKGSPFQLGRAGRTAKRVMRDCASNAPAGADPWQCMQAHAQPDGVMHHNMLAKRHWALFQRMAARVQQRLQRAEAQRERSATAIQSAWRAHVRARLARVRERAAASWADTELHSADLDCGAEDVLQSTSVAAQDTSADAGPLSQQRTSVAPLVDPQGDLWGTEDHAARTIQTAVRGWRVRAEVRRAKLTRQSAAQRDAEAFPEDEEAELLMFAERAAELLAAESRPATPWSIAAQPSAFSAETSERWDQPSSGADLLAYSEREHQDIEPGHQGLFNHLPAEALFRYRGESSLGVEQPESVAREPSEDGNLVEWWRVEGLDFADDDVNNSTPRTLAAADSSTGVLDEVQLVSTSDPKHIILDSEVQNRMELSASEEPAVCLAEEHKSSTLVDMKPELATRPQRLLNHDRKADIQDMPKLPSRTTNLSGCSSGDRSASSGQSECTTSMHSASGIGIGGGAAGAPACDNAEACSHPEDDVPQQTGSSAHHGPQQPLSKQEMRRQAAICRVMEDWGFKDWATAEAFYKSQQHQLRSTKDSHRRRLLQDPSVRLARIKSKVEALAEGEPKKQTSMQRGSVRLQSSSSRRHSYAAAYLRMQLPAHQY
ncbi:probable Internalin A at N-terminal half [Coccomyxa sp. Obi]|nr:probable Internalin A at N-terminal half [Coccomyxa sp. Obi]